MTNPQPTGVDDSAVHFSHCYQGDDYSDGCKYGDVNCPAKPKLTGVDDELDPKQELFNIADSRERGGAKSKGIIYRWLSVCHEARVFESDTETGNVICSKCKQLCTAYGKPTNTKKQP